MQTFPRKGVELSTECEVLFPDAEHERPAVVHRFENGSSSARFRTQKAIYRFTITFTGAEDDFGAMMDFINDHGVVTPFTLVHPHYGTGTAKLRQQSHSVAKAGGGSPPWFRIEIPVEAVF